MATLNLRVRYFQDNTPEGIPRREENFKRRELVFPLPVEQTALVLIDLWDKHHIESWAERADKMVRDVIAPLVDVGRRCGITIVHAPGSGIADKHNPYKGRGPAPALPGPTWPPAKFRAREGEFAIFRGPRLQPPGLEEIFRTLYPTIDVSPHVKIRESDFVIVTGKQLQDLCEERQILHLLMAGFATNWCIMDKDYGVRAMVNAGYNVVLLRDATEGVEFPDTLQNRLVTELAIRHIEQAYGFSASNKDFLAACQEVLKARQKKSR